MLLKTKHELEVNSSCVGLVCEIRSRIVLFRKRKQNHIIFKSTKILMLFQGRKVNVLIFVVLSIVEREVLFTNELYDHSMRWIMFLIREVWSTYKLSFKTTILVLKAVYYEAIMIIWNYILISRGITNNNKHYVPYF